MAWKRDEYPSQPEPTSAPPRPATAGSAAEPQRPANRATIGPSIFIQGDLSGEEDLVIEGRVEGKVDLKQNNLTVGKNGRVKADIYGRVVTVEGEVDGNVFAREQAVLRQSGAVRGNITSPRVTLEDGSRFKGSIDMEPKEGAKATPGRPETPAATAEPARPAVAPPQSTVGPDATQAAKA
jgi:cytoskeletal protein CcmA (bactofilin family)